MLVCGLCLEANHHENGCNSRSRNSTEGIHPRLRSRGFSRASRNYSSALAYELISQFRSISSCRGAVHSMGRCLRCASIKCACLTCKIYRATQVFATFDFESHRALQRDSFCLPRLMPPILSGMCPACTPVEASPQASAPPERGPLVHAMRASAFIRAAAQPSDPRASPSAPECNLLAVRHQREPSTPGEK